MPAPSRAESSTAGPARARSGSKRSNARGYLTGFSAVAATTAFSGLVGGYLQHVDPATINLVAVVLVSMRFGIGPSLATAALSALSFDFFFIPPVFSFASNDMKGLITIVVMLVVAGVISGLGERTRRDVRLAHERDLQIEAERLRNALLSAVSHDLRTPLAAILGAGTALLRDGRRLEAGARDGLAEAIVEEAARLDQLVTNVLELAKFEGGAIEIKKRPEPLDEIVETCLSRLHGRLGNRPLSAHVPQEVPMVPMDPVLIQQVIVNLLENAIRYTPESSPIEVEVSRVGDEAIVQVKDRGPGIDEEESKRLFDRFYRGRSAAALDGGAGLGLTICRSIVEAHGGTISIANRPDGGACARFSLPLGRAEVGAP